MESADPEQTISAPLAVPWATTNSTERDLALDRVCHDQQGAEFKGCGLQHLKCNFNVMVERMLFLRTSSISAVSQHNLTTLAEDVHIEVYSTMTGCQHISNMYNSSATIGCQHICHMYSINSSAGSKVLDSKHMIVQSSTWSTEAF